jgi:hypothetical protein
VLLPRERVAALASAGREDTVRLVPEPEGAVLSAGDQRVDADVDGPVSELMLSRASLHEIADAAVGPDLICDIGRPGEALIWRAPAQPDFIALVMPRSA